MGSHPADAGSYPADAGLRATSPLVPSELLLSTQLPTLEGWIAELSLD